LKVPSITKSPGNTSQSKSQSPKELGAPPADLHVRATVRQGSNDAARTD
jgi:hypothetical protein